MATETNPYPDTRPYRSFAEIAADVEKKYQEAHDPKRAAASEDSIIQGAWFTAFLVPVVGFVLGAILTTRQREMHGIWAMVVSTVMALVWGLVLRAVL
ncbi:MAG TPA: hypothetical protein VEQ62_06065 [Stellaceae bacterium]|jgi:hypothetical protein|nr:hypothetical protein [Stellaceae bacterium]